MASTLPNAVQCCDSDFCLEVISVSVPGPQGPPGPAGEMDSTLVGWFRVDNLAGARALPSLPTNAFMVMLGGLVPGDTFGGYFYWDNTSNALDDYSEFGGSTVTPTGSTGSGRWKRI